MRKILVALLLLIAVILTACGPAGGGGSNADPSAGLGNMDPEEYARLLMASQRLNAGDVNKKIEFLEDSSNAMESLVNLVTNQLVPLSSASVSLDGYSFDGSYHTWSSFDEYSNSADYFENISGGIISSAKNAGELIDDTKENVRVVDKWVDYYLDQELYLHVGDDYDMILRRDDESLQIFERFINEDGDLEYRMYTGTATTDYEQLLVYVPEKLYEMTGIDSEGILHTVRAENLNGTWKMLSFGQIPTHNNLSVFVFDEEIAYHFGYLQETEFSPAEGVISIDIISPDLNADIVNFDRDRFTIQAGSFQGIAKLQAANGEKVNVIDTDVFETNGEAKVTIVLEDGRVIEPGDTFAGGVLEYDRSIARYYDRRTTAAIEFFVKSDLGEYLPFGETVEAFNAFLEETGITTKRDLSNLTETVNRAYAEAQLYAKYHKTYGATIETREGCKVIADALRSRIADIKAEYEKVKDAQVIDFNDKEAMELAIKFAEVEGLSFDSVELTDGVLTFKNVKLTVNDTTLYVKDREYHLVLGLVNSTTEALSTLIPLHDENCAKTVYDGGDSITLASDISVQLPTYDDKEYKLVVYVATSNEVRLSQVKKLISSAEVNYKLTVDNVIASVFQNEQGEIIVGYTVVEDIHTKVAPGVYTYEELYDALAAFAYEYGTLSTDPLQISTDGTNYTDTDPLTEGAMPAGSYRIKYFDRYGNALYAYTELSEAVADETTPLE